MDNSTDEDCVRTNIDRLHQLTFQRRGHADHDGRCRPLAVRVFHSFKLVGELATKSIGERSLLFRQNINGEKSRPFNVRMGSSGPIDNNQDGGWIS